MESEKIENSSRFFKNPACSYFPCHEGLDADGFNCLFCYCPLYTREVCPGNPTFIKKEDGRTIKRCTDCTFPHRSENYDRIMNLLKTVRTSNDFEEYHHGGERCEEITLDMSVNTNPTGLPAGVRNAILSSVDLLERYPDQNCTLLRKKLALSLKDMFCTESQEDRLDFPPKNIVLGNGASELISLFVQAVSPKNALLISPTFSGYERALKNCRTKICHHILSKESDFTLDDTIFSTINKTSPDMIFICTPNNPTGKMIDFDLLKELIEFCNEKGIFLLVDECFIGFTDREQESAVQFTAKNPHLIVLNAFTKIYAMAGIRLGFAVTSNQGLTQKVKSLAPEWNVSSIAQIAGISALEEHDYILKSRNLIREERNYLTKELKALGFKVYPSNANFILFEDVRTNQTENNEKPYQNNDSMYDFLNYSLLKHGILLRNCGNFNGLNENFWRTAVRTHEENEKLIETLKLLHSPEFLT